mmetsp:Transcript_23018/g.66732  ORF Transcript_23018/g.66732 Transcript_23018/m.66732 type:complete len:1247 (+) Transcript_23018:117-3857(+)
MGRVHQIVVENFKSYAGRVDIGPFRKFTCVIGPNGAGKSNLMDAISFVLGVQARQLRSEKLRDLVYRKEGEDPKKNQRTAYVELTYVSDGGGEDDPMDGTGAGGRALVFRRTILKDGTARFQVNDENVSQADYHKTLESINILSKVRNFLVFQGDVTATAQRQGRDLTAFFEQISGSEAYKQEYESLAAEKAKLEDNARYLFTKKRNALNEKKRVYQQKEEADEYRRLEAERFDLLREFFLFRLHGVARGLEAAGQGRADVLGKREKASSAFRKHQHGVDAAERERAQAHLNAQQAEKALVVCKAKLERLNPERVSARSRFNFLQQRIQELKENKYKDETKQEKLQSQIRLLYEERTRLEAEQRQIAERSAERERRFTPEQRQEFARVRGETERVTAATGEGVRQLEQQIRALAAERAQAEADEREYSARKGFLEARNAELREAEQTASAAAQRAKVLAQQRTAELTRAKASFVGRAEEKEQLQHERQQLMDTVQDIAATERQLARERELLQVCSNLSSAIRGVHGRMIDLCRPSQKRLHVAVNVALGRYVDAVIVENSETARACVRYLKERMLAPMTFLPLADLRVASLDPRLGEIVSNARAARLAMNCVAFDERFARAFEFVLGGVVVADTMADGRRLAFGEVRAAGLSCKVVTLAGEAIAKNGNLSVNSDAAAEGATRFDLSELDSTRSRLEAIDRRLGELHREESATGADIATLHDEVRRLEAKSVEAGAKLRWCQEQLAEKGGEQAKVLAALEQVKPQAASLAAEEARLREEQRELERSMAERVKGHFAELSRAMGVADVQKVEREWRSENEASGARYSTLIRQLRNIRAETSMLEETLKEQNPRVLLEELLPKLEKEIVEVDRKEKELANSGDALSAEVQAWEDKVRASLDAERQSEKALSRLRQEAKEQKQELMAFDKRLSDLEAEERSLRDARADLLRQSVLEDVEVPLLHGGNEALQDLAEAPSQLANAPTQGGAAVAAEAAANVTVDFRGLPQEKQAASVGPAAKLLEDEYRAELERLRVELRRLSPNLKAIEQITGVAESVTNASKEADVARRDVEDIERRFEEVRRERKARFLDCFTKVAEEIGNVYKRLTANTAGLHSEGGAAYLDLEDTEDPFNGGVKFTAMPPAKRFRDMHLLSGGEKTLAAMALLFAVHAYQRPPFMVLDEVDAALDANNVRALADYVAQRTECQTIVISLKDRFFVRGEALVGVWKDKPKETSAVLTLDLMRYLPGPVN